MRRCRLEVIIFSLKWILNALKKRTAQVLINFGSNNNNKNLANNCLIFFALTSLQQRKVSPSW